MKNNRGIIVIISLFILLFPGYPAMAQSPTAGHLVIQAGPLSPQVWVDGLPWPGGPIVAGSHRLQLAAPGYETVEMMVEVLPGQTVIVRGTLADRQPPQVAVQLGEQNVTLLATDEGSGLASLAYLVDGRATAVGWLSGAKQVNHPLALSPNAGELKLVAQDMAGNVATATQHLAANMVPIVNPNGFTAELAATKVATATTSGPATSLRTSCLGESGPAIPFAELWAAAKEQAGWLAQGSSLAKRVNILLIGSDSRDGDPYGRTDTIMIATVDPVGRRAGLLSIPRDLWVSIPGHGENRINTVYRLGKMQGYGGPALLKQTIQANLGIVIDFYAAINFEGFKQVVDGLDGIDVCVPEAIDAATRYGYTPEYIDPVGHYSYVPAEEAGAEGYKFLYIEAGWQHLNGEAALRYARSRATPTSDFARMERQQTVLLAIRDKALQIGIIPRIPQLWTAMRQAIETDLTLEDMLRLARLAYLVDRVDTRTIGPAETTGHTTSAGASVLLPQPEQIRRLAAEMFGG